MDPDKVSLGSATKSTPPKLLTRRLAELDDTICVVQIGTHITKINIPDELLSKGLVITSIHDALRNHTDTVRSVLESSDSNSDKFTALNKRNVQLWSLCIRATQFDDNSTYSPTHMSI